MKLYWVSTEGGIANPGERGFKTLAKAEALALKEATACSWICLTPPAPDNEVSLGKGNFRCGATAPHGVHIRATGGGCWTEEYDVPEEKFQRAKGAGPQIDWTMSVIIDRGTDHLADGEDTLYFTGPERTDSGWDQTLDDYAGNDEIVEAIVRPTPFGRYSHLDGVGSDYPMEWEKGRGF